MTIIDIFLIKFFKPKLQPDDRRKTSEASLIIWIRRIIFFITLYLFNSRIY